MKTELTKEQSKHLCELGFPKWKVKEIKPCEIDLKEWIPTITISDLLEILPKEIKTENNIYWQTILWTGISYFVGYRNHNTDRWLYQVCLKQELIDALYELTIFCLENKYLKFN